MVNQDSDDYELMPSNELDDLRREVSTMKKGSLTEGEKARILMESMDRLAVSINRLITILDDAQKDIIEEYQDAKPAEKLNQLLDQNEAIAKAIISMSENMSNASGSSGSSGSRNPLPTSSYQDSQSMPQQVPQQMLQQKSQMMQQQNPQQMQQPMYPDMQQMPQQMQQMQPPMYPDMQQMPQQMQQMQPPMYPDMQQMPRPMPQQMQQMPQQNMQMNNMQGGNLKNILPISDAQYMNPRQQQMSQSMPYNPAMQMGPGMSMGQMDDFPPMDDIPPLDTPVPSVPKKKFLGIM